MWSLKQSKEFVRSLLYGASKENQAFESGRSFGYEEGMRDGLELRAKRSFEVSEEEYMKTINYLVENGLEFVYSSNISDPRNSGLILRKSYPSTIIKVN